MNSDLDNYRTGRYQIFHTEYGPVDGDGLPAEIEDCRLMQLPGIAQAKAFREQFAAAMCTAFVCTRGERGVTAAECQAVCNWGLRVYTEYLNLLDLLDGNLSVDLTPTGEVLLTPKMAELDTL